MIDGIKTISVLITMREES